MDYRLSDPYLDPPGTEGDYVEKTIRLPRTYWCYQPRDVTPEVALLPAPQAGHVTFGCLNNFAKVSAGTLDLWARVLLSAPGSRMIIHSPPGRSLDEAAMRLEHAGVERNRLEFVGKQSWAGYVQTYSRIDIALDPFPYGGGITTCDGLWMGVPIVTLTGRTAVGRGGTSILSNLGLTDLIARDENGYLRIAVELAGDLTRLGELRKSLRQRMKQSPLMDAPAFARDVESIYQRLAFE